MLIEFAENNINYSIMYGTLLGAVKNGVFIPWDDDCDVVFKRNDYEKFFGICKKDLNTAKFFLREHLTNPCYLFGYSKLRRNDAVFKRTDQGNIKQYDGIFMDSFIHDNIPEDTIEGYFIYLIQKDFYRVVNLISKNDRLYKFSKNIIQIVLNFLENIHKKCWCVIWVFKQIL